MRNLGEVGEVIKGTCGSQNFMGHLPQVGVRTITGACHHALELAKNTFAFGGASCNLEKISHS